MQKFTSNSPQETSEIAAQIAYTQGQGGTNNIILLEGNLGAGKTLFASSFINALAEDPQKVTSPTFNLVQIYDIKGEQQIWHFDLYRLKSPDELYEIGLEEAIENHTCLIEWPEIAADFFDGLENLIYIKIDKTSDSTREIEVS